MPENAGTPPEQPGNVKTDWAAVFWCGLGIVWLLAFVANIIWGVNP